MCTRHQRYQNNHSLIYNAADQSACCARARLLAVRSVLCLVHIIVGLLSSTPASAATFQVSSAAASGAGTLERAINDANANPGLDRIEFNIFGLGPHTILVPVGGLPTIVDPVIIDGYTEPGASPATDTQPADIRIVLDGTNAGSLINGLIAGLVIQTSDSKISGIVIRDFQNNSINIDGANNVVEGCHIGIDASGTSAAPNVFGISVSGDENTIGGTAPAQRNVISGNEEYGVNITGDANRIIGNFIGTDATGLFGVGNGGAGVYVTGSNNLIGDVLPHSGNVIAGNFSAGVSIEMNAGNRVRGNRIGTDITGMAYIYNQIGIFIKSDLNIVGGPTAEERNIISGNFFEGIKITGNANVIQGNYIGSDITGSGALPNYVGIRLIGKFNQVGGLASGTENVISGNTTVGIAITSDPSLNKSPFGNLIQGNLIGTDANQANSLGNGESGILIDGGLSNIIGWGGKRGGNVVASNGTHGVEIASSMANFPTRDNIILGNDVGINQAKTLNLGNGGSGIYINGGEDSVIGGLGTDMANTIAFNDGDGVTVETGIGNAILGNAIYANQFLSIDLGADGITPNDADDLDVGPNNLQNKLTGISTQFVESSLIITATLNSTPNTDFRVEVFTSLGCAALPMLPRQARLFLAAETVYTDASGIARLSMSVPAEMNVTRDGVVTSVTELVNNVPKSTSELSLCSRVTN